MALSTIASRCTKLGVSPLGSLLMPQEDLLILTDQFPALWAISSLSNAGDGDGLVLALMGRSERCQ